MTNDYLPKHATTAQACAWLQAQTGDGWTLARLMEHGLMPWFWLDYNPDYPKIFGNRVEGYLAPMVFAGDTQRLEADGTDALVNITRTHDETLLKIEPGIRVPITDLRFKREDVQGLLDATPANKAGKKWTYEKLKELKAFREAHTMPETADEFGISEQRIRVLLPSNKPKAKRYDGLIHRTK